MKNNNIYIYIYIYIYKIEPSAQKFSTNSSPRSTMPSLQASREMIKRKHSLQEQPQTYLLSTSRLKKSIYVYDKQRSTRRLSTHSSPKSTTRSPQVHITIYNSNASNSNLYGSHNEKYTKYSYTYIYIYIYIYDKKAIYSKIFDKVISQINNALSAGNANNTIF